MESKKLGFRSPVSSPPHRTVVVVFDWDALEHHGHQRSEYPLPDRLILAINYIRFEGACQLLPKLHSCGQGIPSVQSSSTPSRSSLIEDTLFHDFAVKKRERRCNCVNRCSARIESILSKYCYTRKGKDTCSLRPKWLFGKCSWALQTHCYFECQQPKAKSHFLLSPYTFRWFAEFACGQNVQFAPTNQLIPADQSKRARLSLTTLMTSSHGKNTEFTSTLLIIARLLPWPVAWLVAAEFYRIFYNILSSNCFRESCWPTRKTFANQSWSPASRSYRPKRTHDLGRQHVSD